MGCGFSVLTRPLWAANIGKENDEQAGGGAATAFTAPSWTQNIAGQPLAAQSAQALPSRAAVARMAGEGVGEVGPTEVGIELSPVMADVNGILRVRRQDGQMRGRSRRIPWWQF